MKSWIYSKTLWVNLIAIGALIVRAEYGLILMPEAEIALLGAINLLLRIITKEELVWK